MLADLKIRCLLCYVCCLLLLGCCLSRVVTFCLLCVPFDVCRVLLAVFAMLCVVVSCLAFVGGWLPGACCLLGLFVAVFCSLSAVPRC